MYPLSTEKLSYTTASVETAAVGSHIHTIRLIVTTDAFIDIDKYPHATSGDGTDEATWVLSTAYALGDVVVGTATSNIYFQCVVAGDSNATEPTWDTDVGDLTVDNEVTWITRALNPTVKLEVDREESFTIKPGEKIAVIQDAAGGDLFATQMT